MVDTVDSKPTAERREGSNPSRGTKPFGLFYVYKNMKKKFDAF